MALISKMNRCAVCGSSEVVYNEAAGLYHCPVCGKDSAEPMPQADLTAVNRDRKSTRLNSSHVT